MEIKRGTGARLRVFRKVCSKHRREKGFSKITQETIAKVLGLTRQGVSAIERDEAELTEFKIQLICKEFKEASFEFLAYDIGEPLVFAGGDKSTDDPENENTHDNLSTESSNNNQKAPTLPERKYITNPIPLFVDMEDLTQPDRFWQVPDWADAEMIVQLKGLSMNKLIYPGAPVALTTVDKDEWSSGVFDFGKPYVIVTRSHKFTKIIRQSKKDGFIRLENRSTAMDESDDFDLPLSAIIKVQKIRAWANEPAM